MSYMTKCENGVDTSWNIDYSIHKVTGYFTGYTWNSRSII